TIGPSFRLPEVGQRHRVEVVVGERDEAEFETTQFDDLADHAIDTTLPRLLAVGSPHRAERTVLRAAANRLDGGPHVAGARQQVPSRRDELIATDPAALVNTARASGETIIDDL